MPEKSKDKRTISIFPENSNFGDLAMQTGKVFFFHLAYDSCKQKFDPDYFGD